jgi:hypothetical protein
MENKRMSFPLWTLACGVVPKIKSLAHIEIRQARMHPQSKDGSVLRLRSRRALSPAPSQQHERALWTCQLQNERNRRPI